MGSGIVLKRAINKYGLENFEKEILEFCDCYDHLLKREAEIVNEQFLERDDVYNLAKGGGKRGLFYKGGEYAKECSRKGRKVIKQKYGYHSVFACPEIQKKLRETLKNKRQADPKYMKRLKNGRIKQGRFANTPEARAKKKETMRKNNHQQGKNNSQYGTMWITNGKQNKKINKNGTIPSEWYNGRVLKKEGNGLEP